MRNSLTLTAAIATVLSQKFAGSAEVVQAEPDHYRSPTPAPDRSYSSYSPSTYLVSEAKKKVQKQKRKRIATASRKRNRK